MKTLFAKFVFVCCVFFHFGAFALATEQDESTKAAKEILASIQQNQFDKLWELQTSKFFKERTTKDSFLANMKIGRLQLGDSVESKFIDMSYAQSDPQSGFKGEIYAFNFLNTYIGGKFYERIVVVKEKDGKYRLSGLWGAPAK